MPPAAIRRARVGRIRVPKSYDVLADHLREQILSGKLAEGTTLPAERDLVGQTGLSRGSVREALRTLESEGLVHTRPGRHGGSIISRPGHEAVTRFVSLFIRGRRIQFRSLIETREAIEPMLAELAARHRTAKDVELLKQVTADLEGAYADVPRFLVENVNWHNAVAIASHNELLAAFLASISNAMHDATAMENFADDEMRKVVIRAHRRVLEAIVAGDPDAARRRMERHVKAYREQVMPAAPSDLSLG